MDQEMHNVGDGGRMTKLKGLLSRIGGTIKAWSGRTKHAMQAGAGRLKGRSRRAES